MIDDREEIPYIPPAYRKVMEHEIIDDYESGSCACTSESEAPSTMEVEPAFTRALVKKVEEKPPLKSILKKTTGVKKSKNAYATTRGFRKPSPKKDIMKKEKIIVKLVRKKKIPIAAKKKASIMKKPREKKVKMLVKEIFTHNRQHLVSDRLPLETQLKINRILQARHEAVRERKMKTLFQPWTILPRTKLYGEDDKHAQLVSIVEPGKGGTEKLKDVIDIPIKDEWILDRSTWGKPNPEYKELKVVNRKTKELDELVDVAPQDRLIIRDVAYESDIKLKKQGMKRATKVSSLKVSQAKKVKVGRLKTVLRKVTIKK